jgi:hypothetical protein
MNRLLHYALVLTSALVLAACTGIPVSTDYQPGWQLPAGASYAWLEPGEQAPRDPLVDNDLVAQRVKSAVNDALRARGLQLTEPEQASYLIAYHVAQQEKIDIDTFHSWYGYYPCWSCYGGYYHPRFGYYDPWWGPGPDVWVREYTEGTLVIDLVDAESRQLVWRGQSARRLPRLRTPEERTAFIRETVNAILADFPHTAAGQ